MQSPLLTRTRRAFWRACRAEQIFLHATDDMTKIPQPPSSAASSAGSSVSGSATSGTSGLTKGSGAQTRIDEIISRGQKSRPGGLNTCGLLLSTAVLLWCSFTPLDLGPLAWLALVPLLMLVRVPQRTWWLYRQAYLVGFVYWLLTLQWMRLGDPSMYLALTALAAYLACYWPIFLALTRTAVWRYGIPLFVAVPVFWVGLEYIRAYLVTGFSWYYLGHTQHNWIEIVQISDLFGAYGVSFLVALANGAFAQVIPLPWVQRLRLQWPEELRAAQHSGNAVAGSVWRGAGPLPVAISLALVLASLGYGYLRRSQSAFTVGPRVGLIQGNFTASLRPDFDQWGEIFRTHHYLTGLTVPYQPDVVIWPEAMFRYPLMEHDPALSDEELDDLHPEIRAEDWKVRSAQEKLIEISDKTDAALVIGVNVFEASRDRYRLFNSAAFVTPQAGLQSRYDKIHRVPFGEYIPLKESLPFIQSLTPFRGDFGIDAGHVVPVFRHQDWNMLPLICFEDTVPHLVRRMVSSANSTESGHVDLLVNLTNDGWFHGSSELDQHLITSRFRSIETRTPLVRAVNTGISAFIDGDGVVREPQHFLDLDAQLADESPRTSMRDPKTGRFHRQLNAALVADVPLDPRNSLYLWWGDWFAATCLVGCLVTTLLATLTRTTPPENSSDSDSTPAAK